MENSVKEAYLTLLSRPAMSRSNNDTRETLPQEEGWIKVKSTKNNKKQDKKFHSKKIKHDPSSESARAVFGLTNAKPDNKKY